MKFEIFKPKAKNPIATVEVIELKVETMNRARQEWKYMQQMGQYRGYTLGRRLD